MIVQKQNQNRQRRVGFTLMELLVVVAIIVILAGVGGFTFMKTLEDQRVNSAIMKANTIFEAVKAYAIEHDGNYPNSLQDLLQRDGNGKGPYLESADRLLDPWGAQYGYDPSGSIHNGIGFLVQTPHIFTNTPDGRQVGNWPLPKA